MKRWPAVPEWFRENETVGGGPQRPSTADGRKTRLLDFSFLGALTVLVATLTEFVPMSEGTSGRVWLSAVQEDLYAVGIAFWGWGTTLSVRLENEDSAPGRFLGLMTLLGRVGPVLVIIGVALHVTGMLKTSPSSDVKDGEVIRLCGMGACSLAMLLAIFFRHRARTAMIRLKPQD